MCILVMFRYIFSAFTASSVLTIRRTCGTVVYGYHYCTTSFNKAWTQVLRNFKSCSRCIRDSQWWESLTMIPAENKVKRLSSVNHTKKTIHHHHQHQDFTFVRFNSQMLSCTDESSNDETCHLLPRWFASDSALVCIHPHNICGGASAQLNDEEQSFWKLFNSWALFSSLSAFWLCSENKRSSKNWMVSIHLNRAILNNLRPSKYKCLTLEHYLRKV